MRKSLWIAYILIIFFCLAACGEAADAPPAVDPTPAATPAPAPTPASTPTPTPTPEPKPIRAELLVAGDIVMHEGLNEQAFSDGGGTYDYAPLFEDVRALIEGADYASCCIETTFPGDGHYTGYPNFRSPDEVAAGLAETGFDLIATASNHAMDALQPAVYRTLDVLDAAGLDHVGSYRSQAERDASRGVLLKDINGIRIAFLDYTYGTNGYSLRETPYAVNTFIENYTHVYGREIDYETVSADLAAAKAAEPDLIAVALHWGVEYSTVPDSVQTEFADWLFSKGVDLILGGHPHVPQPMEMRTVTDENGKEKQGFICYSLGNLLSTMNDDYTDITALLRLSLEKDPVTGETVITEAGYIPAAMVDLWDFGIYDHEWRYRLWDLHAAAADYEAGNDRGLITERMYGAFLKNIEELQSICGAGFDLGA